MADADGRFIEVNPAACALTGYTRDELLTMAVSDVTLPAELEAMQASWDEFATSGEAAGEYLIRRKDGSIVPTEFRAVADVVPGTHVSVLRDLSDRRRAECERERRIAQQAAVADLGRFALAQPSLDELLGRLPDLACRHLGSDVVDVARLDPETACLTVVAIAGNGSHAVAGPVEALDDGSLHARVVRERRVIVENVDEPEAGAADGEGFRSRIGVVIRCGDRIWGVVTARSSAANAFVEGDTEFMRSLAHVIGLAAARQEVEDELRDREVRLSLLLQQLPVLLWAIDSDQRMTLLSGSALAGLQLDAADQIGQPLPQVLAVPPETVSTAVSAHEAALCGESSTYEADWQGLRWSCRIQPLRDRSGVIQGVIGVGVNVTDMVAVRAELEESLAALGRIDGERRRLLREVITARDGERRRISRELHDDLGQLLASAALYARALEQDAAIGTRRSATMLRDIIDSALVAARQIVSSLRPPEGEEAGFTRAVRQLAQTLGPRHAVEIEVVGEGSPMPLETPIATAGYRIVQEAITNAIEHNGPSSIAVVVSKSRNRLTVVVEDDGVGLDEGATSVDGRAAVAAMRARAEAIGGTLTVESAPGSGTAVRLEVALEPEGDMGE